MLAERFRNHLDRLLQAVPGSVAASIMGADGIPIDVVQAEPEPDEPTSLFVEYGTLIEQFRSTAQMFAAGDLEELAAKSERFTCVMRPINGDFYLALILHPSASVGRGRFHLRILAPSLHPDLS